MAKTSVKAALAPSVPSTAVPVASAGFATQMHNPSHQVRLLREAVQSDKVRIGYFIGAGCPLGIYDDKDQFSVKHIPDVAGLTLRIRELLQLHDHAASLSADRLCPIWDKISNSCECDAVAIPNVEHILSEIRTLCGRRGTGDVDGVSKNLSEKALIWFGV